MRTTISPGFMILFSLCDVLALMTRKNADKVLRDKDFAIPRFNTTTHGKHSITYIGLKIWNLLLKKVRDLPSSSLSRQRTGKLDLNIVSLSGHVMSCLLYRYNMSRLKTTCFITFSKWRKSGHQPLKRNMRQDMKVMIMSNCAIRVLM